MNRRTFLKSAAALAGSVALPAPVAVAEPPKWGWIPVPWGEHPLLKGHVGRYEGARIIESVAANGFSGFSFRSHSERPPIDYVEPDRLIYKGMRGKGNVPVFYEPAREYLGVL